MSAIEASSATLDGPDTTDAPLSRLLDSDLSKFRSFKQVIVLGRPGSGIDGVGDALKQLGFKVYDFQTASSRYERDFPLWLEAAHLRSEGRPYSKSDYDKVIGDHNALVGAPTSFFDHDLVKLYPGVKFIIVTYETKTEDVGDLLDLVTSRLWSRIDPVYYNCIREFLRLACDSRLDLQLVRETVREKHLLEIRDVISWVPLCEFLDLPVPDEPAPELHDNTTRAELRAHPRRAVSKTAKTVVKHMYKTANHFSIIVVVTVSATLATGLGIMVLFVISSSGPRIFNHLATRFMVCDVKRLHAAMAALATLICGFMAGYVTSLNRTTTVIASPPREYQTKTRYNRKKGKQGRGRQFNDSENTRPERPTLPSWSGIQDEIRKDDAEMRKEGKATFEEWRNGKHVTFNVTHKLTESGQQLWSGPRKVLSVTEETVE
ncbi:hypothetical protein N0V94_008267 [Neodidymelliopsis sp. IMI 364377]|nr:hypothetical protein N0V94_008267 [Neodidymelliopsis sp. IMI 364377]